MSEIPLLDPGFDEPPLNILLEGIPFEAISPSFFRLKNTELRLVFDGALWWLYDDQNAMSFEQRAHALEWLGNRMGIH